MITLLKRIFLENWQRKLIALAIAIAVWFMVNDSLTTTKTLSNVPVRFVNIPEGKTIQGMQSSGLWNTRIPTLSIAGNKDILEEISSNDMELILDASNKPSEWIAQINKGNLSCLNPDIDVQKGISRVYAKNFIVQMKKLVSEKVPVFITQPIGEPPRGYQFLDIWPYQLYVTLSGSESALKKIKARGLKHTFNLSDITKAQLDELVATKSEGHDNTVEFFVPDTWKQLEVSELYDRPVDIDDIRSKELRIDFIRDESVPINCQIPVSLFFQPEYIHALNPKSCKIVPEGIINLVEGQLMITSPVYARGVDHLFTKIVQDSIQIIVVPSLAKDTEPQWNVQFINAPLLEERYVSSLMTDSADEMVRNMQPEIREEYLRNRFRSYMQRFSLYGTKDQKLSLSPKLEYTGDK